ncbi:hypothetical protein CONCODRAFT_13257 [Conidiobolus coronatus NRRL 28638]|uniref:G-protein coupled receptors family 1 profile domain-containing protein n=1 Tax=Conidiobolus coronatus (strain ATCC 28846 / CBS 209.66 / NRRL 28638) TaxID=796925 RepID=A0A137NR62_CONC2|nr:hypothetical protein CONCODRAFT_13257 [Conidiobolus coronatus NRRL 28638]|eukprot:KXN65231.1 hypothetical protein CONCODRAFT_13257 [Conidiobolus coronatus NRRL 28638]
MENIAIEIDNQQGVYKTVILAHFFIVSIVAISVNLVLLGIIIRKIYRGTTVDLKISALVMILDFGAAIGTFIRAIICQDPKNLLVYDPGWCKFDTIFTTQLFYIFWSIDWRIKHGKIFISMLQY